MRIGIDFRAGPGLRMEAIEFHNGNPFQPILCIGNNVSLNHDCHIACSHQIQIGNDVLIGSRVFITDHYHGETNAQGLLVAPSSRVLHSPGPVIIEDRVWIGEGVSIMPGVSIGCDSVIGANAVVTKSIGPRSVAAGVPAKIIRVIPKL